MIPVRDDFFQVIGKNLSANIYSKRDMEGSIDHKLLDISRKFLIWFASSMNICDFEL